MSHRYGINNFVYTARRPFHPRKLFSLIHDKFILLQNNEVGDEEEEEGEEGEDAEWEEEEEEEEDEDSGSVEDFDQPDPEVILEKKRNHPAFGPMLRSKGFFWLATRPYQFGEWSQAGGMLTIGCGGTWFCEVPDQDWPEDEDVQKSIKNDFQGEWGDRRQEIVIIGEGVDKAQISALLDDCLLDDAEMQKWEKVMRRKCNWEKKVKQINGIWEDGWEEWPEPWAEDEHQH